MSKDRGAKMLQEATGYSYQRCVQLVRQHWAEIDRIAQEQKVSSFEAVKIFGKGLEEK